MRDWDKLIDILFRIMIVLMVVIFFLALAAALRIYIGFADELQSRWVICTTFVNIRARASMNSDTIGRLMCGDEITVDQTLRRGGRWWYHCIDLATEETTGWVCADYCTDSMVTVCDETATVTASGRVAIRASIHGKRTKWVKPDTELNIIAYSDTWALSTRGYIKMEYLTFDQAPDPESDGDPDE